MDYDHSARQSRSSPWRRAEHRSLVRHLPPPQRGDQDETRQHDEPLLSAWGAEKLIPLRFVHLVCPTRCFSCVPTGVASCTQPASCGDDNVCHDVLLDSVTKANQVFKSAGVQFYVSSIERYSAPDFVDAGGTPDPTWAEAYAQLAPALPGLPSDAWFPSGTTKRPFEWLQATAAVFAPPQQILVWIVDNSPSHNARQPEQGRNVLMVGPWMPDQPYKLAHELGHFLGLPHTWQVTGTPTSADLFGGVDPETLVARKKADLWDLAYKPGTSDANPHIFYTSQSGAAADEAALQGIQQGPCKVHCAGTAWCSNCQTSLCGPAGCDATCCQCCTGSHPVGGCDSCVDGTPDGLVTCHVGDANYSKIYTNGHTQIKGHARVLNGANALNIMSYRGDFKDHPYFLSDAQIHLVRKYLRWDVPTTEQIGYITTDRNTSYYWAQAGRRPLLGSFAFRDPLAKLDFNGDGLRDIGVWIPPTSAGTAGLLKVLLSPTFSQSSGSMIDTQFGRMGDIPVPMDFDNDTGSAKRTDFGVFQPGGGANRASPTSTSGYWRWCITASTPSSTNCSGISQTTCTTNCAQYGIRGDVPTPGLEFNGTLPNEYSVYRASNATWYWYAGTSNSRVVGDTSLSGAVPLPGLYDDDDLVDLVVYYPMTAQYHYRRSEQGWNTSAYKNMGSQFVPMVTGTAAERAGAFPMPMFRPVTKCIGDPCIPYYVKRRSFSLFWPHDGSWNTLWEPFGSGAIESCVYGVNRIDQPFSGFDRNGDYRADYGIHRATTYGVSTEVHIKNALAGSCGGTNNLRNCATCGVATRALAVADMTGDGREELVLIHTHTMTIEWRTSESDYTTTGGTWAVGNSLAQFL